MKIKCFILIALCLIILFSLTVNSENIVWQKYLKDFLTNSFPSLFDEATIKKNEENLIRWLEDDNYIPDPVDIPIDMIGKWGQGQGFMFSMSFPRDYHFYDLDNDNIPEVIINYGGWELSPTFIYKLNGNRYEQFYFNDFEFDNIDNNKNPNFHFYINTNNKIVVFRTGYVNLYSVNYIKIQNGELTLVDYIDSAGSNNYYGLNYNNLFIPDNPDIIASDFDTGLYQTKKHDGTYKIWANDFAMNNMIKTDNLTPLPEFDCSDVLEAIKYGTSLVSPKTGDDNLIFFAVLTLICFALAKLKKVKRINNV
ncbi:MAG: hypothetical protein FWF92_04470 [Oscillospiraceae bacterium]|nr:hypothetical protein [Oscillospiraceae bacterium]